MSLAVIPTNSAEGAARYSEMCAVLIAPNATDAWIRKLQGSPSTNVAQGSFNSSGGLLGPELEVLPQALRYDLQVLREQVRLVLRLELPEVPPLGDVVHLTKRGRLALRDHVPDKVEHVHRPQQHQGALQLLRGPNALQRAVLPHRRPG